MSRLASFCFFQFALAFCVAATSLPAVAQDLDDLPVGTVQNFGPNLQTGPTAFADNPKA